MGEEARRDSRGGPRIVVTYGQQPWRCLLCGAAVIHVDDHYEWHVRVDQILLAFVATTDPGT